MQDLSERAPLAALNGARPPGPPWFEQAVAMAPERSLVDVEGAAIEALAWGPRGAPGLLFLHGAAAHADWWGFVAPFFADRFRVAALSWSGMGGSAWRERYGAEVLVSEAFAVAEHAGLFQAGEPPIFVGHSFGAYMTVLCAAQGRGRLKAAVAIEAPVFSAERRAERAGRRRSEPRPTRIYPSLQAALARFRFAPPQGCEHLFIADFLARGSVHRVDPEPGQAEGWTWRFDPFFWKSMRVEDLGGELSAPACPIALVRGSRSKLIGAEDLAYQGSTAPPGSPVFEIPDADHHVMVDQPLAFVAALEGLLAAWP